MHMDRGVEREQILIRGRDQQQAARNDAVMTPATACVTFWPAAVASSPTRPLLVFVEMTLFT